MWDRLLIDCHVATMVPAPGDPLGIVRNGSIGIQDGKVVRVGKRTELAGYRAKQVDALGGAWVTPGLVDCHTHLIFGGNRADEHAMRRAGATYQQIAEAGTVTPFEDAGYLNVYSYHGKNVFPEFHHRRMAVTGGQSPDFLRERESILRDALRHYRLPEPYSVTSGSGQVMFIENRMLKEENCYA